MRLVRKSAPAAVRALACLVLYLVLRAQPWAAPQATRIDSISPSTATEGQVVTIRGIGFGAGQARVMFNRAPAVIVAAAATEAQFRVPAGLRPGPVAVTVINPDGHTGSISFRVAQAGVSTSSGVASLIAQINALPLQSATKRALIATLQAADLQLHGASPTCVPPRPKTSPTR